MNTPAHARPRPPRRRLRPSALGVLIAAVIVLSIACTIASETPSSPQPRTATCTSTAVRP